jgi:ABC-2 type transport system ATP-binding protein
MKKVIEVENLTKKYGKLTAVDDISFYVEKGEVFGLLGENGAGKTTTMEMIEGLRKPTGGKISVLGLDTRRNLDKVKEKIGVQLQSSAYFKYLNLTEILELFGSFYKNQLDPAKLLSLVGLSKKAKSYIGSLSGGQQQRFSIVASLVNDPEIIFLDEPTTGLDPLARRNLWGLISKINKQGKTILFTTHYMEEAETLCDRIAIMDRGKIVAMDRTHKLIENTKCPYKIRFIILKPNRNAINQISKFGTINNVLNKSNNFEMKLPTQTNLNKSLQLIEKLNPESIVVTRASLEDLFIQLTGKNIEE